MKTSIAVIVFLICAVPSLSTQAKSAKPLAQPAGQTGGETPDADKSAAFAWIDSNLPSADALSLEIWNEPELSFREFKSSRAVAHYLSNNGFQVQQDAGGLPTSFVASYGSGKPVIAFWAECDALAAMSQKAQPAREPVTAGAPGHACGHSVEAAATASAAVAVAKFMQRTGAKGTLRVYGTPAEEAGSGKDFMLQAGVFKDVDVLLGWHTSSLTRTEYEYSKAWAELHFHFKGVASHASVAPWKGRSALHAVELMDAGVNDMREQLKEDARVQYVITNGGGQPNVIPADAESWYYVRADTNDEVVETVQWITEIAKGAAMMTRTRVDVRIDGNDHEVLPNRPLAEVIDRNLRAVGAPRFSNDDNIKTKQMLEGGPLVPVAPQVVALPDKPTHGAYSTDLGNTSWQVPTERFVVSDSPYALVPHTWQEAANGGSIGLKAIPTAAKTLAGAAIDLFKDASAIDAAKKDFEDRKKGYIYTVITPPDRKPPVYVEGAQGGKP